MRKDLDYYMNLNYPFNVTPEEDGSGYMISFPDLPGCLTSGKNIEEAIANIPDAKKCWFEAALEDFPEGIREPSEYCEA